MRNRIRAARVVKAIVLTIALGGMSRAVAGGPECAWAGIYPTVLAPFCDGGIDVAALEAQLHYQIRGGVRGLLVLGTIGEGEYATWDERAQVIATSVRVAGPQVPVVVGIHTCRLDEARVQVRQARDLGAAAVLVKYFGDPHGSADTALGFMAALSEMQCLPIFYYHYPSETGLKLKPCDVANILHLPGVVGIKESTLNLREVQAHRDLTRGEGKVFLSGTALNLTQFIKLGGHGAMCPEAVLLPGPTVQAFHACAQGRWAEARAIQNELFAIVPILKDRPTPPAIARTMLMTAQDHRVPVPMGHDHPQARLKAALTCLGVPTPTAVKCPLPPLTSRDARRVCDTVGKLRAIDWADVALQVPAEPLMRAGTSDSGGMLLRTGSFILGPGVGRDLLRSQGDGK